MSGNNILLVPLIRGQLVKVIITTSVVISVARALEEILSAKVIYETVYRSFCLPSRNLYKQILIPTKKDRP